MFMGKTKLIAAVAAAAFALSACNGASTGSPAATGPATTAPDASSAGKQAFDSLKSLSDAVAEKSSGAKSAHVTFTGDAGGQSIKGEGDFSFGADTAMRMTVDSPEGAMTVLFVGETIYIKTPQELQPGKAWLKIDLSSDNPLTKSLGGSLDSIKETDPSKALAQLAGAGEITATEKETLDGAETTHYSITVDVAKLDGGAMGMDPTAVAELEKAGVKELPVEIWVDGDNLPVRFVTEVPAGGAKAKVQADYSDWGKAVDITAPPAAEVAELPGG